MFASHEIPAAEIVAGDFTTFSGFRRVQAVETLSHTSGRGKKRRTTITGYKLHRFDGSADTVYPDALVTVRRPVSDGPS